MPVMLNAAGVYGYVDPTSAARMLEDEIDRLDAFDDHRRMYGELSADDERAYQAGVADAWQLLQQIQAEQRMDEEQAGRYRRAADVIQEFYADDTDFSDEEEEKVRVSHDPRSGGYVVAGGGGPRLSYKSYPEADAEGRRRATVGRAG